MKNLSELIAKHEEIYGDQSERITSLPTMTELRMTEDENFLLYTTDAADDA